MKLAFVWAALSTFFVVQAPPSSPQDWTQWRGPQRDGHTLVATPAAWAARPVERWKVTVGLGHSSPIVAGGRVYLHARQGDEEVASAFDLATGKTIWTQRYAAPYQMNPAATGHGPGPKSTPVFHAGKLYTLGISGIFSCFDAATGAVKWRKDFGKEWKYTSPDFGTAMSPIVDSGLVIVHVGGPSGGALRAFDAETGATKWSWNDDGPAYASPIVVDIGGTRQLITQTQKHVISVAPATGTTLWRVPFTTAYDQNIVTPLACRDTVIISGENRGTAALRVAKTGTTWTATKAWENADVSMYMSSPILDGDTIIGLSHRNKGQFFALDARTGATRWTSPPRQGENAAIVAAGRTLFLLRNDAQLILADARAAGFTPLKTYEVATSETWAYPVVLGDRVLIKDERTLALLTIGAGAGAGAPASAAR